MQKMSEKCFKKCIYKPGSQLDNSEQVRFDQAQTDFLWDKIEHITALKFTFAILLESCMQKRTKSHNSHFWQADYNQKWVSILLN